MKIGSSTSDAAGEGARTGLGSRSATSFEALLNGAGGARSLPHDASASTRDSGAGNTGSSTQQTDASLQNAMANTQAADPTLFAKTLKDGQTGDGNALVQDELQAYKNGDITKQQAIDEVGGAQSLANAHGGGKINKNVIAQETAALGTNVIHGGKTRGEEGLTKFLESFTGIGAIVKGIGDKTKSGDQPDTILTAAQPALQQGMQQALQDMQQADPELAQKFQSDGKAGDGNAMVDDLVQLKSEETAGEVPDSFSDQDAQLLGSQIGSVGKGKVNGGEDQKFTDAFGTDTLDRGSTRGSKGWDKVENTVGGFMQQIVSPVTDSVGAVDQLAHGNVKGALSEFGQAVIGGLSDAAMIVAPEAAPEIEVGAEMAGTAARAGLKGAEGVGEEGAGQGVSLSGLLNHGSDIGDDVNTVSNYLPGNSPGNGNRQQTW